MNSTTGILLPSQRIEQPDLVAIAKRRGSMLFATVTAWQERAVQRRRLCELDDRMLRDIGIHREAALQAGRKPFWRD